MVVFTVLAMCATGGCAGVAGSKARSNVPTVSAARQYALRHISPVSRSYTPAQRLARLSGSTHASRYLGSAAPRGSCYLPEGARTKGCCPRLPSAPPRVPTHQPLDSFRDSPLGWVSLPPS